MIYMNDITMGTFRHKCEFEGCENYIIYDDEPLCYKHSPDSGSSVKGYSAFAKQPEFLVYHCFFSIWQGFMDGVFQSGDEQFDLDFVDRTYEPREGSAVIYEDTDSGIILNDFSEEGARLWFSIRGYEKIKFVYPQ